MKGCNSGVVLEKFTSHEILLEWWKLVLYSNHKFICGARKFRSRHWDRHVLGPIDQVLHIMDTIGLLEG